MTILDEVVDLINNTTSRVYVFLADHDMKLARMHAHCLTSCDLSKATTRIILWNEAGLKKLDAEVDGVFVAGIVPEEQIRNLIPLKDPGFVRYVKDEDWGDV